jgi:hypothetical protein
LITPVTPRERTAMTIVLAGCIVWQLYAVVLSYRTGPMLAKQLYGLGAALPFVTRAFFSFHRLWFLVPTGFFVLSLDVLRRPAVHPAYFGLAATSSLLASFALHAWLNAAVYQPVFELLNALK